MKGFSIFLAIAVFLVSSANADDKKEKERLENAGQVITEIMNIPDNIPQGLLDKARCVVVLPSVVKGAFIVGANYGRGVMTCRGGANFDGPWGAPTMMALEGASFGFQLGAGGFHAASRRRCQQESVWQRDQCARYCAEWRSSGASQRQGITGHS